MAYQLPLQTLSLKAGANYSSATSQFTCVDSTAAGVFLKVGAAGAACLGILQNLPATSENGSIAYLGVTKARVNVTTHIIINPGDKLVCTSGAGVRASSGTLVTNYVIGRALSGIAANTTGIITMLFRPEGAGSSGAVGGV